ncbi:MAG: Hsp20/alpha crystallin family protein [Alicyclobacillus macrosporangiidus]|uniref:Hsp20/alpha crystallin family protein n=1 Tax=Alicyclobacillus macrosporangiidus TaxID=392015 RepID=UPI0026F11281|nr:Hsp20/alpha crystallin family protein [Alicyclobacillus macrosporangiidus]MCL6599411.1 Hsp20/alpha crystallin family protein [Alicyclobacillus macrosporangiidus]
MPLIPYDPLGIFRRENGLTSWPALGQLFDNDWFRIGNMPRVDVRETPTDVIVTAEIPGLERKEDVNIVIHDRHLHLSGEIHRTYEEKRENIHRAERFYGQFSRTVPLPAAVEEDQAKATYRNGVLEITIPKAKTQIGKRIDVDFH